MINPAVAHRNEVVPAAGVKPNSAVGITGMIELTDETGVLKRTHASPSWEACEWFFESLFSMSPTITV
jgi:hypothetical protein